MKNVIIMKNKMNLKRNKIKVIAKNQVEVLLNKSISKLLLKKIKTKKMVVEMNKINKKKKRRRSNKKLMNRNKFDSITLVTDNYLIFYYHIT